MDRLSDLPNEILNLILERLPLMDKVRTSALSIIWRLKWTHLPSLIMDEQFYHRSVKMDQNVPVENVLLERSRVAQSVVLQHRGGMREFSLFVPGYCKQCPTSLPIYQDTICSAVITSSSSLEKLILNGGEDDDLLLPPSVFSLLNLRHLEIRGFWFEPPSCFEGFSDLTFFLLASETIPTCANTVQRFVSLCPKLETVNLEYVDLWEKDIDLKVPQLSHLYVGGLFNDIFVSNAQNLDSVSLKSDFIGFRDEEDPSVDAYRFLKSATQLKDISLNGFFCEYGFGSRRATQMCTEFTDLYSKFKKT